MELHSTKKLLIIHKLTSDVDEYNPKNITTVNILRKTLESLSRVIKQFIEDSNSDLSKYPQLLSLKENINTDYQTISDILSVINVEPNEKLVFYGKSNSIVIESCKILINLQNYEKSKLDLAQNVVKNEFKSIFSAKNPIILVELFSVLCECAKDLQTLAQRYNKDLVSSSSVELQIIFKNIFSLISIASKTMKMKFSYENDFWISNQYCINSMNFHLEKLQFYLKISQTLENFNYFPESRNFTGNVDQVINLLQSQQNDDSMLTKTLLFLQEIINYSTKLAQFCRQPVQSRIIESCNRLSANQIDLSLNNSNWIDFTDEMVDEIETLEKIVNMGILRLVFDLATVSNLTEKRLLQATLKLVNKKSFENGVDRLSKYQKCLNEFENYKDRLVLAIIITANCSSNTTVSRQLKFITTQLQMIADEYIKGVNYFVDQPTEVTSIYHLQLIQDVWNEAIRNAFNLLLSIIDVLSFLQLTDSRIKEVLSDIEDHISEGEFESIRLSLGKMIRYSMSALDITKVFMQTEKGRNGRKAINLGRDQILCGIKMLNISFKKYLENLHDHQQLDKLLTYSKILQQSIQKLLSTCIDVTSTDLFDTETASQSFRDSLYEIEEIEDFAQSVPEESNRDYEKNVFELNITDQGTLKSKLPDENLSLEFGISDILEELSSGSYFSDVSSFNECFSQNIKVLQDKQKHLLIQVKNLEIEMKKVTGFQLLSNISASICDYISDALALRLKTFNKSYNESTEVVTALLKRALCEVTNTRVLYEISSLMQHFEIAAQQIDSFLNENKEIFDDVTICKLTNSLKQLIKTLDVATQESIITKTGQKMFAMKSFSKQFRSLGFDSSVGYFSNEI